MSKSNNLGPLNLAVLSVCTAITIGPPAWYFGKEQLLIWTFVGLGSAIIISMLWYVSRFRRVVITVQKKHKHWKREYTDDWEDSSGGKVVMYMVTTDKGLTEVKSHIFNAIDEGQQYRQQRKPEETHSKRIPPGDGKSTVRLLSTSKFSFLSLLPRVPSRGTLRPRVAGRCRSHESPR